MKGKNTKAILNNNDINKIKSCIKEADNQLIELSNTFSLIEQRREQKETDNILKKLNNILIRIDIKSGINLVKILLWIVMAWAIVKFSSDINAKIISTLTFMMGLVIDMMLLRKQLPQVGYTAMRLSAGAFSYIFGGIIVLLVANLASVSMGGEVYGHLEMFINRAIYICGFCSTFLEFINSIAMDD